VSEHGSIASRINSVLWLVPVSAVTATAAGPLSYLIFLSGDQSTETAFGIAAFGAVFGFVFGAVAGGIAAILAWIALKLSWPLPAAATAAGLGIAGAIGALTALGGTAGGSWALQDIFLLVFAVLGTVGFVIWSQTRHRGSRASRATA
jgi:hypothetical protein